jgi:hypothetical protein
VTFEISDLDFKAGQETSARYHLVSCDAHEASTGLLVGTGECCFVSVQIPVLFFPASECANSGEVFLPGCRQHYLLLSVARKLATGLLVGTRECCLLSVQILVLFSRIFECANSGEVFLPG